jgi:hypothetical protein
MQIAKHCAPIRIVRAHSKASRPGLASALLSCSSLDGGPIESGCGTNALAMLQVRDFPEVYLKFDLGCR